MPNRPHLTPPSSRAINIAIAGCIGRMGLALVRAGLAADGVQLTAGSVRPGVDERTAREKLSSVGGLNLTMVFDPDALASSGDAIIDFTSPLSTLELARAIASRGGVHIIGTTGFSEAEQKEIERLASQARIVQSGNFSLGVNLLESMVKRAANVLGDAYTIEISETHHIHKKDAPSGTALMLSRAARRSNIDIKSHREGEVVGIHSVYFSGPGEKIELKHEAVSRDIFAYGAIHAARWAVKQKPGLYSMRQVLGL